MKQDLEEELDLLQKRCEEANETNYKKIKLNTSILKDNLEKRRLKLKKNINLSKEISSKFKYSPKMGRVKNNLSRNYFNSINDQNSQNSNLMTADTNMQSNSTLPEISSNFLSTPVNNKTEALAYMTYKSQTNPFQISKLRIGEGSSKSNKLLNGNSSKNVLSQSNSNKSTPRENNLKIIKQSFNAQNDHPFLTFYNKCFQPSSRNRMKIENNDLDKFINKIDFRKLCIQEDILPVVNKRNLEDSKSIYKLANLVEKTNSDKGIKTNKLELIKEIKTEIINSNKERAQLAELEEIKNKLKAEKEVDLKTYNIGIMKRMKGKISKPNFKLLTLKLKETYILSNQPLKSVNKKKKEIKIKQAIKEDEMETEIFESSTSSFR